MPDAPPRKYLFVGGPHDGKRLAVAGAMEQCVVPCSVPNALGAELTGLPLYRRLDFTSEVGKVVLSLYASENLTNEEAADQFERGCTRSSGTTNAIKAH